MKKSCKFVSSVLLFAMLLSSFAIIPAYAQQENLVSSNSVTEQVHVCSDCTNSNNCVAKVDSIYTTVSSNEILSRLVSQEPFSLDGTITTEGQTKTLDEYYDFSSMSRFAIADLAYEKELITEAQMIECYCDLLTEKNFENVICLDPFYNKIKNYEATTQVNVALDKKITSVLNSNTYSLQTQPARRNSHSITVNGIYIEDVFNILSDSVLNEIGAFASSLRTLYENRGFDFPGDNITGNDYVILLSTSTAGLVCDTISYQDLTSTTCLSATYIHGVNRNTVLNDSLRQRIAHGMFHAIQNTYNRAEGWFKEACADWGAWSTTGLTTGINFNAFINARGSMTNNVGRGAMLFPVTIARYYGGYETIVEIYEQLSTVTTTILPFSTLENKINAALAARGYTSVDFADIFSQMSGYLAVPSSIYSFVASGLQNTFNAGEITYYEGADFTEDDIRKLDRAYFSFTPDEDLIDYEIEFEVGVLGNPNGDVTVQQFWYNDIGEAMIEYLPLNANGVVSFSHPHFDEGNPSGFVGIIITNTNADAEYGFYIDYVVTQN